MKLKTENLKLKIRKVQGFTLIELLVVIAILGVLIGIAVPSLISFNRRQELRNAAGEVKSALRFAQNKALAAEVDDTLCTTIYPDGSKLLGWYVHFPPSGNSYYISGRCAPSVDFGRRDFVLPGGTSFTSNEIVVLFCPTTGGVSFYLFLAHLGDTCDSSSKLDLDYYNIFLTNNIDNDFVRITQGGEIK